MTKKNTNFKEMPETHVTGHISIENVPTESLVEADLGIQISEDGRVWVCVNGIALLRFKPKKQQ